MHGITQDLLLTTELDQCRGGIAEVWRRLAREAAGMRRLLAILLVATFACGSRDATRRAPLDAGPEPQPVDARKRRPAVGNLASFTAGMIRIPAGSYRSGCPDQARCGGEPPNERTLPEFYLDRTEVTVEAYERCVAMGKCTAPTPTSAPTHLGDCSSSLFNWGKPERSEHPINCLKPQQAAMFCAYRQMHLPTERQLEKASRGSDGRVFPWGNDPPACELAIIATSHADEAKGCGKGSTWPVGSLPAGTSPFGVVDLIGNVAELATAGDVPLDPATITNDELDAMGIDADGKYRGVHAWGGGFEDAYRFMFEPWSSDSGRVSPNQGFRCAYQPSFEY